MSRHEARKHAFHLIFRMHFAVETTVDELAESKQLYYDFIQSGIDEVDGLEKLKRPTGKDAEYVDRVVYGVFDRMYVIDKVISNFLRDWTIDRISSVDLAIMRLAIYEMLREPDVPLPVAVNEAVELAKLYGDDDSPGFIGGLLGRVRDELKAKGRDKND